jgi:N-acetyl-D-muramate 6-phosphate phosphatase
MPLDVARIRAICFDIDGTLSDTDDLWVSRLEKVVLPFKAILPHRNARGFARRVVMELDQPGNYLLGLIDRLNLDSPLARLLDQLTRLSPRRKKSTFWLIPHTATTLQALCARYPLAIVSVRGETTTRDFLQQTGLAPFFSVVAHGQVAHYTKPFPDPILWAAGQFGLPPEACLMVGDTNVDIHAGKLAGAQTVGVMCGFGRRNELERAGADLILATPADLLPLIAAHDGSKSVGS